MNVLWLGLPLWNEDAGMGSYRSQRGHELRTLGVEGEVADYTFAATETAAEVIARIGEDWQVDLLLCWLPELFPPPRAIEECPIPTVAAISDWNIYFPQMEANLARYDLVLSDRLGAQRLRLRSVRPQYFYPLYSQCSRIHRTMDVEKDIDILFVGNLNHVIHARRGHCLERLATLSTKYNVQICHGYLDEEYTRILNRARIVFNHSVRSEMNLRCFETLACNALLFLEEDNLEASEYLRDREHAVFYRPGNLVELLVHYLENDEEREAITRQGHALAGSLALENRLDDLFDYLQGVQCTARPFQAFSDADKGLAEVMQYSSSLPPSQHHLGPREVEQMRVRYPDAPEFLTAAAQYGLESLSDIGPANRKASISDILAKLHQACQKRPGAAVLWLNLAAVCQRSNARDAIGPVLRSALQANSCDYAGLLAGSVADPYYITWRGAFAVGEHRIEMLWASAATRLAVNLAEAGAHEEAREWAERSIAWQPGIAEPYRALAFAEEALGRPQAAAERLAESLPLTSFDAEHRLELIRLWRALGEDARARELADESAAIFDACEGQQETVDQFRAILDGA